MEIETEKSNCFTQTEASILILVLLSESYIKKKILRLKCAQKFIQNLQHSCQQEIVLFLQDFSKLPTKSVNSS